MGGRHIALLVEDEPQMASELGELLESLGHGHIHAATKEEAERLVEGDDFCYVLLDLQIKVNADSIKAHVEAGQTLLEFIRARYPRRNNEDKYRLPILVMSGHAKEHYYVVKALQDGADDFVTKPLGESRPPFKDKLQEALRRSGREKHERCAAIMREAVAAAKASAEDASANGAETVLLVDLREHRVTYRGHEIRTSPPNHLQRQTFFALAVLANRCGKVLSMVEIADEIFKLGGLERRPTTPDARDLRYKLAQPFKKALGTNEEDAVDQLFECVPGVGLRLNLAGGVKVVSKDTKRSGPGGKP